MATSSPSSSHFANMSWNNNHGLRRFGDDGFSLFKQAATRDEASPFDATNKEHTPGNPFQSSRLHANGSLPSRTTCQTKEDVLRGASAPSFSFGISSPFMNQREPKTPPQHSPQSGANFRHGSFSAGRASPFAPKTGNTTQDSSTSSSFSFGKSPSSFSFGKSPILEAASKEHEPRIPFQQSPIPFSSSVGKSFLSVKPETQNPFQKSVAHVGDGTSIASLREKEAVSSKGSMPNVTTPRSSFASAHKQSFFWGPSISKEKNKLRAEESVAQSQGFFHTPSVQGFPHLGDKM